MAGESQPRSFTEGEAYALVADNVARETAAAKAQIDELTGQVTTLSNEKDALLLRVTAAEEGKGTADKALEDFKTDLETQKAAEAKRGERLAAVAAVAPGLDLKDVERADRIVAMDEGGFTEYVGGLREIAATAPHPFAKGEDSKCSLCKGEEAAGLHERQKAAEAPSGTIPRETAAFRGAPPAIAPGKASVKGLLGARRALATKS